MIRHRSGDSPGDANPRTAPSSPGVGALTDESCVLLAREGTATALDELARRYVPGVFHLLVRLLADRERAADATQEVFLRVGRHLHQFDARRSFRSWIYAIAWNFVRDEFRRKARRRETKILSLDQFRAAGRDEPASHEPVDDNARRPDEMLEQKERGVWLRQALARMEPTQRALLVLREYEGLSYAELARLAACKVGTLKSRLNRARLALKGHLEALRPDWIDEAKQG